MAGFAGAWRPHPGKPTTTPAAFKYPLAVSLRTPVACSMRRKDHPSFPNAITCCFLSSLKTLLMPREPTKPPLGVNVLDFPMAGFQPTLYGRFWATPEGNIWAVDPKGVLRKVAEASSKSAAQVALNWCISKENVIAIPKASTVAHVQEDIGASGWKLQPELARLLEERMRYRRRGALEIGARRAVR